MHERMDFLTAPLLRLPEYNELIGYLKNYTLPVSVTGPSESQKAHFTFAFGKHLNEKVVFVSFNEMQARRMYEDFTFFLGDDAVLFPSREVILHNVEASSNDDVFQRLKILDRVQKGDYKVLVTSAEALSLKLIPADLFRKSIMEFETGKRVDLGHVVSNLIYLGYERTDVVEGIGQFAVRGGIIDIYPVNTGSAVRIELFDDEVDSIRCFDINSQRSVDRMDTVRVIPAREVIYPPEARERILDRMKSDLSGAVRKKQGRTEKNEREIGQRVAEDIDKFVSDYYFPGIDRYMPYIVENPAALFDYTDQAIICIDEPIRFGQRLDNLLLEHYETCKGLLEKGRILPGAQEIYFDGIELLKMAGGQKLVYESAISSGISPVECRNISMVSKATGSYQGHMDLLCQDISAWKSAGYAVVVLSGTKRAGRAFGGCFALKRNQRFIL